MITDVDFLIATNTNPDGLEQLVLSIAKHYPGAHIYIGDTSKHLVRADFKDLATKARDAGLISRLRIKHLGYNASAAAVWTALFSETTRKYKLLLNDSMLFTELTDIDTMVHTMETQPKAMVVNGTTDKGEGGVGYDTVVSTFALLHVDLFNAYRWKGVDIYQDLFDYIVAGTTYHVYFCTALIGSSIIEKDENTREQTGRLGNGDGTLTQPDVPGDNAGGGQPDGKPAVLPSGQNEKNENTNTSGRQGAGAGRPVQRQGNKQNNLAK